MLRGHSIVGGRRDIIPSIFVNNDCSLVLYWLTALHCSYIFQDARSRIVDTLLTLHWCWFWDILSMFSWALLPRNDADSPIMHQCDRLAPGFFKIQRLQLLMLPEHSILGHSDDLVQSIFACIGSRLFDYRSMLPHSTCIFQVARPKVVHPPLTFIFWT